MAKKQIKDRYSRVIGTVDTKPNGDAVGYDFYNGIVGTYYASRDVTVDFYRRIVGTGNQLVALIWEAEAENREK